MSLALCVTRARYLRTARRERQRARRRVWLASPVADTWDEEFHPSSGARRVLRWAHENGASTLAEAYDLLDQLEISNDIPEVLGEGDTVDGMREELEVGIELIGADASLSGLM
jgi:hypothetical protein